MSNSIFLKSYVDEWQLQFIKNSSLYSYIQFIFSFNIKYIYKFLASMGNDQPKKLAKATKGQIDIACLKAKIHL